MAGGAIFVSNGEVSLPMCTLRRAGPVKAGPTLPYGASVLTAPSNPGVDIGARCLRETDALTRDPPGEPLGP